MRRNYCTVLPKGFVLLLSWIFLTGCTDTKIVGEDSVTGLIQKIETAYDGGEKVETLHSNGFKSSPSTRASQEVYDQFRAKIESDYKSFEKRFKSSRVAAIFDGYDVGVIPATNTCPSWSEKIDINMDNEDSGNVSTSGGDTGSWGLDGNGNSNMHFCRVDGRFFTQYHSGRITVLGLGSNVASAFGSVVNIFIDNEDRRNRNSSSGDLGPNSVGSNTSLYLYTSESFGRCCGQVADPFPNFGFSYYAIGNSSANYHQSDDENSSNANGMTHVSGTNLINPVMINPTTQIGSTWGADPVFGGPHVTTRWASSTDTRFNIRFVN